MNKMLAAALSTIVLATPSLALADDAVWEGNSGRLKEGCTFMANDAGRMSFDDSTGLWTVTDPAQIRVKARNIDAINVVAGTALSVGGQVVTTADVDFRGNDTRITRGANTLGNVEVNAKSVKASNIVDSVMTIELGGKVAPADPAFVTSSSTDYKIAHQITCEQ